MFYGTGAPLCLFALVFPDVEARILLPKKKSGHEKLGKESMKENTLHTSE
jgi:hypothetical protein